MKKGTMNIYPYKREGSWGVLGTRCYRQEYSMLCYLVLADTKILDQYLVKDGGSGIFLSWSRALMSEPPSFTNLNY